MRPLSANGKGDNENALFDNSEQDKTILAIVVPAIFALKGERVFESKARSFETHTVCGEVLRRLGVIPLEILVLHIYGLAVPGKDV
jgi:hypothetical protein